MVEFVAASSKIVFTNIRTQSPPYNLRTPNSDLEKMASSTTLPCSSPSPISHLPINSYTYLLLNQRVYLVSFPSNFNLVSFPSNFNRFDHLSIRSSSISVSATPAGCLEPAILLTDNALKHLKRIRSECSEDLCLRVGVKQGGCSGMSYTMDFESIENTRPDDSVIEHNGFTIVCDPKSLLFLYGMQLDYNDALIGGGFNFKNLMQPKLVAVGNPLQHRFKSYVYTRTLSTNLTLSTCR